MIEVEGLRKSFSSRRKITVAVNDVSFCAKPGKIYGLLGPNGAGKTTALRCIATLLRPDAGTITIDGKSITEDPRWVRSRIGFLTSDMKLSGYLTPRELLRFFGELNHLERTKIDKRTRKLSSYLDMDDFLDRPVAKLSSGMKQKAAIAVSLVHDPAIIIFDEPTAGLDLLASKTVVDFLHDSKERGRTVILSTHNMAEAERLCDTVGILIGGVLRAEGSRRELMRKYEMSSLEDVFFAISDQEKVDA